MTSDPAAGFDRRTFLKLAAVSGGVAMGTGAPFAAAQTGAADKISFADPKYREFYNEKDGYFLRARLNVTLAGVDKEVGHALLADAEGLCPYSKAMRGNVDVAVNLV